MPVSVIDLIERARGGGLIGTADARPAPQPAPFVATFRFLNADGTSRSLELPYAPQGWETEQSAQWTPRGALGVREDASDWRANPPREVTFAWLAVAELGGIQAAEDLEFKVLRPLEIAPQELDRATGEPRLVVIQFGFHEYIGHLTRVTVERVRVDYRGYALQAQVSVQLTENLKQPGER